jgi:MSHA biogenesis protein MshP
MKTNKQKIQGASSKVQGERSFPCILSLATVQRGFSLVTAIFLLVVIAALGTFAVTLSTTQQQNSALDVMGVRAYQAARAGIEWAAYGVSQTASGVKWSGCLSSTNLGVLGGTLAPFSVAVTCNAASSVEGTSTFWIYDVTTKAQTAGSVGNPGFVEREIGVKLLGK